MGEVVPPGQDEFIGQGLAGTPFIPKKPGFAVQFKIDLELGTLVVFLGHDDGSLPGEP